MNSFLKYLSILLIILPLFSCEEESLLPDGAFPDFSDCNCDFESRDFVCTEEGYWYRSECFAQCLGEDLPLMDDSDCPGNTYDPKDMMTWPIRIVCHPVEPLPPVVQTLSDGTKIFEIDDSTFVRGVEGMCRCLSEESLISTPQGEIPVSSLKEGDWVYTQNIYGQLEVQPVKLKIQIEVGNYHKMLKLCLENGKEMELSPSHPDREYRPIEKLEIGEFYDGVKIVNKEVLTYRGKATEDILPAGETGLYKVNGIWVGSTLFTPPYNFIRKVSAAKGCTDPGGSIVSTP